LVKNDKVCIIDGSTAHRVTTSWVYGLPELNKGQARPDKSLQKNRRAGLPCHRLRGDAVSLIALGIVARITP